jgi:hypothetical protein
LGAWLVGDELRELFLDEVGAAASDLDGHSAGADYRAGGGDEAFAGRVDHDRFGAGAQFVGDDAVVDGRARAGARCGHDGGERPGI